LTQIGQEAIHRDGHTEKTKFVYGVVRIIFVENDSRALQLAAFISVFFAKRNTYVALGSIFGRQRAFVGSPALRTAIILCFLVTNVGIGGEKQPRGTSTCGILCLVRREVPAHKSFHREGVFFVCFSPHESKLC
jgi:hypothetical protein